ncbi:MAG: hypothetical protein ACRDV4_01500 [Acidimicrobiales bacterium]
MSDRARTERFSTAVLPPAAVGANRQDAHAAHGAGAAGAAHDLHDAHDARSKDHLGVPGIEDSESLDDLDDLDDLDEERDVLLQSIEDLEREHEAGDLSEADYELLRDRYTLRAAAVLRVIEDRSAPDNSGAAVSSSPDVSDGRGAIGDPEAAVEPESSSDARGEPDPGRLPGPTKPARKRRAWLVALTAAFAAVIVISVVLVVRGTSSRLPGETATGTVSLSPEQQLERSLSQAQAFESRGDDAGALKIYHQVLVQHPDQEQALAESGWLEFEAGVVARKAALISDGQTDELKAENDQPGAYAPHLYLGSMLLVEGQDADSVTQYRLFLSDHPPTSVVSSAKAYLDKAFYEAHLPVPALPPGS